MCKNYMLSFINISVTKFGESAFNSNLFVHKAKFAGNVNKNNIKIYINTGIRWLQVNIMHMFNIYLNTPRIETN